MLVTIFLMLINTSNSARQSAPLTADGTTAAEVWLNACIVFLVVAITEYALLLRGKLHVKNKWRKRRQGAVNPTFVKGINNNNIHDDEDQGADIKTQELQDYERKAEKIDFICFWIFLTMFILFTVIYSITCSSF